MPTYRSNGFRSYFRIIVASLGLLFIFIFIKYMNSYLTNFHLLNKIIDVFWKIFSLISKSMLLQQTSTAS